MKFKVILELDENSNNCDGCDFLVENDETCSCGLELCLISDICGEFPNTKALNVLSVEKIDE